MNKKGKVYESLLETLSESISDALHSVSVEEFDRAREQLVIADKAIQAIKVIEGRDDE